MNAHVRLFGHAIKRSLIAPALFVVALSMIAGCAGVPPETSLPTQDDAPLTAAFRTRSAPVLKVVSPANGAIVPTAFVIDVEADGFRLAPKGEVRDGEGHLHVIVNHSCVRAGEVIPVDAIHVHFGDGANMLDVELPPGDYDLCVQAGDGFHVALGISAQLSLTVAGAPVAADPVVATDEDHAYVSSDDHAHAGTDDHAHVSGVDDEHTSTHQPRVWWRPGG